MGEGLSYLAGGIVIPKVDKETKEDKKFISIPIIESSKEGNDHELA